MKMKRKGRFVGRCPAPLLLQCILGVLTFSTPSSAEWFARANLEDERLIIEIERVEIRQGDKTFETRLVEMVVEDAGTAIRLKAQTNFATAISKELAAATAPDGSAIFREVKLVDNQKSSVRFSTILLRLNQARRVTNISADVGSERIWIAPLFGTQSKMRVSADLTGCKLGVFRLHRGTLAFYVEGSTVWPYEQAKGARYFYKCSQNSEEFLAQADEPSSDTWQLHLPDAQSSSFTLQPVDTLESGTKHQINEIILSSPVGEWRADFSDGKWQLRQYSLGSLGQQVCGTLPDFSSQFGRELDALEPSYEFDANILRDALRDGSGRKAIADAILAQDEQKESEEALDFSVRNDLGGDTDPFVALDCLHKSLIAKEEQYRQNNFDVYQEENRSFLKAKDSLEVTMGEIHKIHGILRTLFQRVELRHQAIHNLTSLIEQKEKVIEGERKIYQGNLEAHSAYGFFVVEIRQPDNVAFNEIDSDLQSELRISALENMAAVLLRSEQRVSRSVHADNDSFDDWIASTTKGSNTFRILDVRRTVVVGME